MKYRVLLSALPPAAVSSIKTFALQIEAGTELQARRRAETEAKSNGWVRPVAHDARLLEER